MKLQTQTLTMLCPTVLAALFALMSSYCLSVGHVSCLPPSLLDLRFQNNHQMKETMLQRKDVLAAELWIQSKLLGLCNIRGLKTISGLKAPQVG